MNPIWCREKDCSCLCSMDTLGGGQCIGRLDTPTDHITEKANTMQWCHYNRATNNILPFHINHNDMIIYCYVIGEALRKQGLTLPSSIVNNLPKGD